MAKPVSALVLAVGLVYGSRSIDGACDWRIAMRDVHDDFGGNTGTIARFGDSIFISQAFFVPLRDPIQNTTARDDAALNWIRRYVRRSVWGWQSPQTGASGGKTSQWPLEMEQNPSVRNIDHWLDTLNPEMALIMWGTNDVLRDILLDTYIDNMREVVQTVKQNGTIPILTTIPPLHGFEPEAALFAESLRQLADEECVPLMDYHAEILRRNPGDTWDGTLVPNEGNVFQVERLISGDGVHPSNPFAYRSNFSEDALNKNGYTLLTHMALMATHAVHGHVVTIMGRADVNADGVVSIADIDAISQGIRAGQREVRFDLDLNGVVDEADHRYMVEVVFRTFLGDSNLDGEFNSSDFIAVFKVGEYEDATPLNSGWADGDWNGDGDFESGDLVLAFKVDAYEKGPRAVVATLPEPTNVRALVLVAAFATGPYRGMRRSSK